MPSKSTFIKTKDIIRVNPDDSLSSALLRLNTSHDAAFVFSQEDKYLGVINPYYCLIKSSHPGNAKVEKCIFHAPHVKLNFSISRVADLLSQSKVHYLPIFDDQDKFYGIVSARRILAVYKDSSIFHIRIEDYLKQKNKPIITVVESETIAKALNIFKETRVSKLVVVNKDMKLKGILSYYDLISYLVSPKSAARRGERGSTTSNFNNLKVSNFAKTYVMTLDVNSYINQALEMILEKKIGSVVVVDSQKHPIGIITTKDLLRFLIQSREKNRIELQEKNLSENSKKIVGNFFQYLTSWMKKSSDTKQVKLFVKEEKQGGVFQVILSLFPKKGKMTVIRKEGKNLNKVLDKIRKS